MTEWRQVVDTQHKELSEKHALELAKCKQEWEEEKQREMTAKVAELVSGI